MRIDFDRYVRNAIIAASLAGLAYMLCGCTTIRPEDRIVPTVGEPITRVVCIGLNRVDPSSLDYRGWDGYLADCELDATRFAALCREKGVEHTLITGNEATVENVGKALITSATGLPDDSLLIVTHSGHGADDGLRQSVCLYDRKLKDATIGTWMKRLGHIRVLWVCDTCHAAGMYRSGPVVFDHAALKGISCELILIAGCGVGESSLSLGDGGYLSQTILSAIEPGISPQQLFDKVEANMNPSRQKPRLIKYGPVSDDFLNGPILR